MLGGDPSGSGDARVRGRVSVSRLGPVCLRHRVSNKNPMPPRITQESYRPRVSDRTMVGNSATRHACPFREPKDTVATVEWNPRDGRQPRRFTRRSKNRTASLSKSTRSSRAHVQAVGLDAETKIVPAPSRRRNISLDIPFYRTCLCIATLGGLRATPRRAPCAGKEARLRR
jgi:hypothetical protein